MAETANYKLYKDSSDQTNFLEWREKLAGASGSNMDKIDAALKELQDSGIGVEWAESAPSVESAVDNVLYLVKETDGCGIYAKKPPVDADFADTYGFEFGGEEHKRIAVKTDGFFVSVLVYPGYTVQDVLDKLNNTGSFKNYKLTASFDPETGHIIVTDSSGVPSQYPVGLGESFAEGEELTPHPITTIVKLGGGNVDLSKYYTAEQADGKFLKLDSVYGNYGLKVSVTADDLSIVGDYGGRHPFFQIIPELGVVQMGSGKNGIIVNGDDGPIYLRGAVSVPTPTVSDGAANKKYVDDAISSRSPLNHTHTAAEVGALASGGTAAAATKLATSRTIRTNLGSTSTASFNGTANVTPGVTGTLGIANGGTGSTTASGALANLGVDSRYLKLSGGDMTGMLDMNGNALTGLPDPVSPTDAVNYQFMLDTIMNLVGVIQTEAILFSSDGSPNLNMSIMLDLKKVATIGGFVVFRLSTSGNILNSPYGYNKVTIKYPSGFGHPGTGWSEIGYEGPKFTYGNSTPINVYLDPDSDGYSYSLGNHFTSGNYGFSGYIIVKAK